jgi:hypothetical protein
MMKKPWKSQKRQKRPRNSNAREHAQITRKVIAKTKWVCPDQNNEKRQIKEEQQKKRWKTRKVEWHDQRVDVLSQMQECQSNK